MAEENSVENVIKQGFKPVVGMNASPFDMPLYRYDESGTVVEKRDGGMSLVEKAQQGFETDPEKARVGDYYYDATGNLNVVPNSPTDIYNKYKITNDETLYEKPTRDAVGSALSLAASAIPTAAIGAFTGAVKGAGAVAGAVPGLIVGALIAGGQFTHSEFEKERAYQNALKEWQKSQEKAIWKVAGNLETTDDGEIVFVADPKKAIGTNMAFAGSEIQKAFNQDTDVKFGDDGHLKVSVNPIFAATDEYKEMVENVKVAYSGLTRDSEGADQAVEEIKNYIDNANNQYKFREQSMYSYKVQVPGASDAAIEDAYTNELGAYMSEKDGENYDVKVYRDGEIKTETAKKVLDDFYNMDLGKRSDRMLDLFAKMDDPTISDDDKVYILSEIKLLQDADANDNKYDNGGEQKSVNKYYGMLDQESIISALNNWSVFGGVSVTDLINAIDAITPWNMHISDQKGLQEDAAAATSARLISAATSAISSYLVMQGIEHKIIRPVAAKVGAAISSGVDKTLEKIAMNPGKLSEFVGQAQMAWGAAKEAVSSAGAAIGEASSALIAGARLLSNPLAKALGFSMGELLYNATSDLAFDAGKLGLQALSGEKVTGQEFLEEFGTDLIMDLVMQYGPAGLMQVRTEFDNYRVDQAYEPFRAKIDNAQQKLTDAEIQLDATKRQMADNHKNSKLYKEAAARLSREEKALKRAQTSYDKTRAEAEAAVKEALPTLSEELGSMLAGKFAKAEQNRIVMWLRKKFTDEKAGLSVIAEQAYNKTSDVYLYEAAVNKFQNTQVGINEVTAKLKSDFYAKGTGESYVKFANATANMFPNGKFPKEYVNYLTAKAEYDAWTKAANGDAEQIKKIEEKYMPYLNSVSSEDAKQLDQVLVTMKEFIKKVGESYVNSGSATAQQMKDIEEAAVGIEYVPLWGKDADTKKFGLFETPLTLRVGKTFDPEKGMFDVENIQNPILSTLAYEHNIVNNIAYNEMSAMLKDIASVGVDGIEIVGGSNGGKPEYEDIVDDMIARMAKSNEKMLKEDLTPEQYHADMERVLDTNQNKAAIDGIDKLIKMQKKLKNLVGKNSSPEAVAKLDAEIKNMKAQVRTEIDTRVKAAAEYFNQTYKKYNIKVDIDDYLTSAKYTKMIDSKLDTLSPENLVVLKDDIAKTINQVAPYLTIKKINKAVVDKNINALKIHTRNRIKKNHPDFDKKKTDYIVGRVEKSFRARLSGQAGEPYVEAENVSLAGAYKIPFTVNGKDESFYIRGKLAKEVAAEMTTKNIADRRAISSFFKEAANIKRLLTTGIDPTRVIPNLLRDTIRNGIFSGGTDYWFFDNSPFGFVETFRRMATAMGDTEEHIQKALNTLQTVQEAVSGSTYNEAVNGGRTNAGKKLVESSSNVGRNRAVKFTWELAHDKRALLETPMNWAEGLTRDRASASAFMRAYMRGGEGLSQETRLKNAYEAGLNAGRENTVNFARRGEFIKEIASYVPYLSQRFSSLESTKIAFIKDPIGVSTRLMMFGAAYMTELSRVLSDERSRKNYYNLSEYDRENNIVLALGADGGLVTIPLDETIAALIYPWRRGLETMHNVEPEDFYMIMVNGFLELSPFDLSGFTEGDSFNFGRGIEKLAAQTMPTIVQAAWQQLSGRSLYYGSNIRVSKEQLAEYGNYNPTFGDYTTTGKNSALLRSIADALGVEQWRLQQSIADLGGNVGQYVVNWLDKIAGAPEDAQGGKEFVDATFKSFTGMDSEQVKYAFDDGIEQLTVEKEKLKGKLIEMNNQIGLASGERMAELQEQYRKVKQDFAMKVGNFVDKYINAYEIAGGLTKTQANKIWYLLNFSDDDSIAMGGSVESYYRELAKKQANNDATKYSANTLDKYYDQTKNVYKDSSGEWHYYSPYGEQAFFNTVQGRGMEYQVGLRNIIEGKVNDLSSARSAAYDARSAAADAQNWDEYDKIGLRFDDQVLQAIAPYVKRYGADNVLTNSSVLDYLEEWFFVPSSYMKSKYGKNVSLAHNASKQRAFVRPYIKELFGLSTAYQEKEYASRPEHLVRGGE